MKLVAILLLLVGALGACGGEDHYAREDLLDPETCNKCHKDHFKEWSGSMHAYASDDPVFLAMNARGQRETGGALGNFCVNCHAPMAVREGATTDGLNMAEVPKKLKGVTCFFCHTVDSVEGSHNAALTLADDIVMRGEFNDPVSNEAHPATYSLLHDRDKVESAQLCGSCHDIVVNEHAELERTYKEWQASVFAQPGGATCGQCHMDQSVTLRPIADAPGVFARRYHSHAFPAIDVALTPGTPEADTQRAAVQAFLDATLQSALCVVDAGQSSSIRVLLDNVAGGHGFPSGASQDRRVWIEVIAYQGDQIIYQSGVVPDGTSPLDGVAGNPDRWLLRDCLFDASQQPVSMFWQADSYESNQLPAQATFDASDPRFYMTHIVQPFPRNTAQLINGKPDRVTLRVRVQPMGLDVLDELVASGDLDQSVRDAMPTYDVDLGDGPLLEWTAATAPDSFLDDTGFMATCITLTNFNIAADRTPATNHTMCTP